MRVNGKSGQQISEVPEVPAVLHLRVPFTLRPLVLKWRRRNKRKAWSYLLEPALRRELAPLAGKRHAHLVNGNGRKVPA